jgi:hypothetical protein
MSRVCAAFSVCMSLRELRRPIFHPTLALLRYPLRCTKAVDSFGMYY